jgi:hypothetical protein
MTIFNFISLKALGVNMDFTDFKILGYLNIFFLILFVLLNIGLLYTEYLDRKYNNIESQQYLKSGLPELKKIAKQFVIGIGIVSGVITIKNEYRNQEEIAALKAKTIALLAKAAEDAKKATNKETSTNFIHKMNLANINNNISDYLDKDKKSSKIRETIKERKVQ